MGYSWNSSYTPSIGGKALANTANEIRNVVVMVKNGINSSVSVPAVVSANTTKISNTWLDTIQNAISSLHTSLGGSCDSLSGSACISVGCTSYYIGDGSSTVTCDTNLTAECEGEKTTKCNSVNSSQKSGMK